MSPNFSKHQLPRQLIALLALSSHSLALASPLTDPAVHAGKGKEAGTLDATGEAKTRVRLLITDAQNGARAQGYRQGFRARADQLIAHDFELGRARGEGEGLTRGRADGRAQGIEDGDREGFARGETEGYADTDRQARVQGEARGTQEGRAEAEKTDAAAQGAKAGKLKGDAEAKASAQEAEYAPAREQYRRERYAERVNSQSTIDLKKGLEYYLGKADETTVTRFSTTAMTRAEIALEAFLHDPTVPEAKPVDSAKKAIAYCKEATKDAASEYQACIDTYVKAYEEAFKAAFPGQYLANYREKWPVEFEAGRSEGTRAADRDSGVHRRRDEAFRDGQRRGFDEAYRLAFDQAYRPTYDVHHEQARRDARNHYPARHPEVYPDLEAQYAQQAHAQAFDARKKELYGNAYETARHAEFKAKYPGYAASFVKQGRADEQRDFEQRPVRLVSKLSVMESIVDGILEPAEDLSLSFDLRNFAGAEVAAKDLDIRAVAVDADGIAVREAMAILTKGLAPRSITQVRGAFTVQLDTAALKAAKTLKVTMSYRGRVFSAETIALQAKTLTRVELAAAPETRLGYPGVLKLQITNQSRKDLPEESLLVLDTRIEGITFNKIQQPVGKLAPGQVVTIDFPFVNQSYGLTKDIPFVATLTSKTGRLTGALNQTQPLPVMKDFEVKVVKGDLDGLAKSGRNRVRIRVYNVGNNPSASTVTVESSIVPTSGSFTFIKGSKVVYSKISPGNYGEQKITVKAHQKRGHGKFVMKVTVGDKFLGYFEENF